MLQNNDSANHQLEALERAIRSCERLLRLNVQERETVAFGRVDDLSNVLDAKNDILSALQALGEELSQGLASSNPTQQGARTSSTTSTSGNSRQSGRLETTRARLQAIVAELTDLSARNRALMHSHLAVTEEMLRFLVPLCLRGDGYARSGEVTQASVPFGTYQARA